MGSVWGGWNRSPYCVGETAAVNVHLLPLQKRTGRAQLRRTFLFRGDEIYFPALLPAPTPSAIHHWVLLILPPTPLSILLLVSPTLPAALTPPGCHPHYDVFRTRLILLSPPASWDRGRALHVAVSPVMFCPSSLSSPHCYPVPATPAPPRWPLLSPPCSPGSLPPRTLHLAIPAIGILVSRHQVTHHFPKDMFLTS